jgi:uncharacterized protein with NRDE domain
MCVLAFGWRAHPDWTLVAIANRDEFHGRPTAALARWGTEPDVLAGRDLQAGGTWLGVCPAGRFVALTNVRSDTPPDPSAPSRGGVVTALLSGEAEPAGLDLRSYGPFSLVLAATDDAWLVTNRPEPRRMALEPGVHGLTNGRFDRPWPKLAGLKAAVSNWMSAGSADQEPLFAALRDERVPDGAFDEATALPPFIRRPVYGTRCSTVVTVAADGRGRIVERRFAEDGSETGETALDFAWPASG